MGILERWILGRFISNFVLLFCLLFGFVVTVDLTLENDEYVAAGRLMDPDHPWLGLARAVVEFHLPRMFQFFQYSAPLVAVAACGFTLAQMHRARELVALMAAGISLRRVAIPLLLGALLVTAMQVATQELVIPGLAQRLLRGRELLGKPESKSFPVPLWHDRGDILLYAGRFDPEAQSMQDVVAIERDREGNFVRRIRAQGARWDAARGEWALVEGRASEPTATGIPQPVAALRTSLDPTAIQLRRERLFAHMLSTLQVLRLEQAGALSPAEATRTITGRVAMPLLGILVLLASLPFFLLREPANLLRQSLACASFAIPALFTGAVLASVPTGTIGPGVSLAIPIALVGVFAAWRFAALRT